MTKDEAVKKGVEAMKNLNNTKDDKKEAVKEEPKKALEPKAILDNLQTQIIEYQNQATHFNTMFTKAQGAIEVLTALVGENNDTKSVN